MLRFISEFLIFFVILAASVLPLRQVSIMVKRRFSLKKWLRAAAIVAFAVAGLGWSSRDLQEKCLAENNEGCIDAGGAGTQFVIVAGFIVVALASAYLAYRD